MSDRADTHTHTEADVLIISLVDSFRHHGADSGSSRSSKNSTFKDVLTRIEGHPDCRNLPMISFLILPMQRITRLPLLMDVSPPKSRGVL